MIILGIESSCDDTSVALLDASADGFVILAEKTASQIEVHKKYGGVVPEIAGRCHAENIMPVVEAVMDNQPKPNVIAVTSGPGLITGLLVGTETAKALSYLWDVPLIGVNHIEGHVHSVQIQNHKSKIINPIEFPALCLVVSGGHTELILMKDHGEYDRIGATRDDAAGECFDKVGKLLGFDYPGGPKISQIATDGNPAAIHFPRPMLAHRSPKGEGGMNEGGYEFSFAGLKTSALYWLKSHELIAMHVNPFHGVAATQGQSTEPDVTIADFCASFEQAIIDVLVAKTLQAAEEYQPKTIILAGGVAANRKLRLTLEAAVKAQCQNSKIRIPKSAYCMDNGAMIASAGYYHAIKPNFTPWNKLEVDPNWVIDKS